ncbi:MAG: hypothetical protein EP301_05310 [Gammaproteobacteria bacterium]|nr:MAG: hypothetical protein EP301_05310 [Gammaproteobacteria bacterium]
MSTYLKVPVMMYWKEASGLPFPDQFTNARAEFQGLATDWLDLERIACIAEKIKFVPGLPAQLKVEGPGLEITIGQAALDRWLKRFQLPYRLELGSDALVVHTEIAGFPVAEFETTVEIVGGWFVLKPKRTSFFGVPGYVSSIFQTYLPVPPLSSDTRLAGIRHAQGSLTLSFALSDFEEEITPGLLLRLRRKFFPMVDQISGMMGTPSG